MHPSPTRYQSMQYRRCGRSGLQLPAISLGLWHNFGSVDNFGNARDMISTAFDLGITHFDLANNYGPIPGSAETNFGKILHVDFANHRDEMIISSKAGYTMWPGPYGDWGSRKYLLSSLDQSLSRMKLDYVDIFYHHRPDPNTPLEETMGALAHAVRQGKALYVGLSNYYNPELAVRAVTILQEMGVPCLIHQPAYNMMANRTLETGTFPALEALGVGEIVFSPLAQGLLTNKYLNGVPSDSRAANPHGFLKESAITPEKITMVRALAAMAAERNQTLAQMALAWCLRFRAVTSVLIGASRPSQIIDCVACVENLAFTDAELDRIETILAA
ncbi:MAG: aldo/keto reductase [Chthoniobacterales bacterium]